MRDIFREAIEDESGQSSVDFLFGFAVFLVTFIFAISFIAGIFVPYQPGAIDLSSVAYRTTAILVEDPGWYIGLNGIPSGSPSWESYSTSALETPGIGLRVGLAEDKTLPDVISYDKANALDALMKDNYSIARDKMGLNSSVIYDVNISLTMYNNISNSSASSVKLITPSCPNATSSYVETMQRNVMVDKGKEMFVDCGIQIDPTLYGPQITINLTNMTSSYDKDVIIRIYNITGSTNGSASINAVSWSPDKVNYLPWSYGDEYVFTKNGNMAPASFNVSTSDIVELRIFNSALKFDADHNLLSKYIRISGAGPIFPYSSTDVDFDYFNNQTFPQKGVYYPGKLQLAVWVG